MYSIGISYATPISMVFGRVGLSRTLPESWADLTPAEAWRCVDLLMYGASRRRLIRELLRVPWYMWQQIDHHQMHDLIRCIEWMQIDHKSTTPVAPYVDVRASRHGRTQRLYLPSASFANVVGLEYALIEDLYDEYRQAWDPEVECRMAAVLLRPGGDSPDPSSDPRVQLLSSSQTREWLPAVRALPETTRAYITTLISANKHDIWDTYNDLFHAPAAADPAADGGGETSGGGSTAVNFGWWGTFMDVAQDGIFGTYDQVLQTPIHSILMHLYRQWDAMMRERQQMEHARLAAAMKK